MIGCVKGDGDRHVDGRSVFIDALGALVAMQEGGPEVIAPAIGQTSAELVGESGVSDALLALTHSCHRSSLACGACPGCSKRGDVLSALGRLG